jgi:PAS domain S-box-containing protein
VFSIVPVLIYTQEQPLQNLLIERSISAVGIWIAAYLVLLIRQMKDDEMNRSEQFRALFQFASTGIILANNRGEIVRINPFTEKLFGYTAQELVGERIEILIPQRLRSMHKKHRSVYARDPQPRSMGIGRYLSAVRKDGSEFPVEVSLSPFKTAYGDYVMAFINDNTIRQENEGRILRQNQRLEQLAAALQNLNEGLEEKVRERTRALEMAKNDLAVALEKERELGELKSRFVTMASHEFRTPLSTVLSSAALVSTYAQRADLDNIQKHALKIKTAVNNLNTILTEFLSLGKLEDGKTLPTRETIDLPQLIDDVAGELKPLFKPGQILLQKHSGPPQIVLDPGLLKHVLINLISNATKYSPENTPIEVQSTVGDQHFGLRVIDRGMGIPDPDKKHLFSRFFRASNANNIQGTGLGLYIVHRYVELMNGEIGFDSEVGQGTTFWIRFQID